MKEMHAYSLIGQPSSHNFPHSVEFRRITLKNDSTLLWIFAVHDYIRTIIII